MSYTGAFDRLLGNSGSGGRTPSQDAFERDNGDDLASMRGICLAVAGGALSWALILAPLYLYL